MTRNKTTIGHLAALGTIVIWGTTFISTKVLLKDFSPIEILFLRFVIGFVVLALIYPHRLKGIERKQEVYFALAGLCGVTLYFLLENIALTYSLASNIGVIVSVSPFFTAIFAHLFLDGEKLKPQFFVGFLVGISGVFLISFNGNSVLQLNPLGDILAFLAAVVWSMYAVLTKKISHFRYPIVASTRRIFFYGLLFMLPTLLVFDFKLEFSRFTHIPHIFNILYLGIGASALCFVTWNFSVKVLGAVKTSVYIYMVPVITVVTSAIILHEKITGLALVGTALTLVGLFISEGKINLKAPIKETTSKKMTQY